jgi:phage gp37-like protein
VIEAVIVNQPIYSLAERTVIEDGVILALQRLLIFNGGWLKALEPYNGDLDEQDGVPDYYRQLAGRAPAVLVTTSTARYKPRSTRQAFYELEHQLELLIVSTHWRSPVARTRGDAAPEAALPSRDPGAYHTMAACRALLLGRRLGVEPASLLRPLTEVVVVQAQGLCVWRQVYEITYRFEQTQPAETPEEYDSLLARYMYRAEDQDGGADYQIADAEVERAT